MKIVKFFLGLVDQRIMRVREKERKKIINIVLLLV